MLSKQSIELTEDERAEILQAIDELLTPSSWPIFGKALNQLRQRMQKSKSIDSYGDVYGIAIMLYDYATKTKQPEYGPVYQLSSKLYNVANKIGELQEDVWHEMLTKYGLCTEDANGNRPCDNGEYCERCEAEWFTTIYYERLRSLGLW